MTNVFLQSLFAAVILYCTTGQEIGLFSEVRNKQLPNITTFPSAQIRGTAGQGIQCTTDDTVTFNIGEWYFPDGSLVSTSSSQTIYNLRSAGVVTLYRTSAIQDLEGLYTCRIPDTTGAEHVLYLGLYREENYINGVPVVSSPPSFKLLSNLSDYPPLFTLTCTSISFPPTFVNWTRDGEDVSEDEDFQSSQILRDAQTTTFDNILLVDGNYSGEYTCHLKNERSSTATLQSYNVTEPFTTPIILDPVFLGSGNVNIIWTRPEGPVYGYLLFYELANGFGSEVMINIPSPNTTYYMISNLDAGATYSIGIIAYADLPTEITDPVLVTLNVAGVPENITVVPSSSTSLIVSWDPPLTGEDSVVGYIVEYVSSGTGCSGIDGNMNSTADSVRNLTITGLEEDNEYNITVRTVSEAALGDPSNITTTRTLSAHPDGPPQNVKIITKNPDLITLSWDLPTCLQQNGAIQNYTIRYNDVFLGIAPATLTVSDLSLNFTEIPVFRNYSFEIAAVNINGIGNYSKPVYAALIGDPEPVELLQVLSNDFTSITLTWFPHTLIDMVFTQNFNYSIAWTEQLDDKCTEQDPPLVIQGTRYEVEKLSPNTTYTFCVSAISEYITGDPMSVVGNTTIIGVVTRLTVIQHNTSSVNISWIPIPDTRDVIFYRIYYNISNGDSEKIQVDQTSRTRMTISNLNNDHDYIFYMTAVVQSTEQIEGPLSEQVSFSFSLSDNTRLIIIVVCTVVGGLVLFGILIAITVIFLHILSRNLGPQIAIKEDETELVPLRTVEAATLTTPNEGPPEIIGFLSGDIHAVEGQEVVIQFSVRGNPKPTLSWKLDGEDIDWESSSFVHRDSSIVFPRVEVEHSGTYQLTAVNSKGTVESSVKLLIYPDTELTRPPTEQQAITSISVPLNEFGQYVAGLHSNGNKKFKDQFRRLSTGEEGRSVKEVLLDEYRPFNRFQHILVYDNNRIRLEKLPRYLDCEHDYINGCYVEGEGNKAHRFIATQGPLDRTVVDMWRLVWQEKSPVIVMLTKLQEDLRIMCSQYWPSKGSEDYGPFTVTLISETNHPSYIVRELSVHYNSLLNNFRSRLVNPRGKINIKNKEHFNAAQSSLRVTQYHYTEWPEHGTVDNVASLLTLHSQVISKFHSDPIVVHCSNGVGRTGSFIALDMALEQTKDQTDIDIPAIVIDIRQQRMKMIQTLDQYMVVHDATLEKAVCGNTQIPVTKLHSQISEFSQINEETGQTGFEKQFNVLQQVTVGPDAAVCSCAQKFARKNRDENYLPTDQWRVPLKGESPDYINATFVPGYKNLKAFIITQGPLRETRRDFWKMIFDQDMTTVIMLSPTREDNQEVCGQYWVNEGNVEFGEYVVTVKEVWSHEGFTQRIFLVRDTKANLLRRIVQFQVDGWSSDGVTSYDIMAVVNTINLVTIVQRKTPNIPILLHCSNRVGRSAILCAVIATIEQCKTEGFADVFHVVKSMRSHLPGAVCDKDQYKTIHTLVAAYLDLFSTSANFEDVF